MRINELILENDEHIRTLNQTGFWGRQGAGCLFYAIDTGRYLVAHRSQHVEEPNTWGTWGGAIDGSEDPKTAMLREVKEETGYSGSIEIDHIWTFEHKSGFRYHNFLAIVPKEFTPKLDWENRGYKWVEFGAWPAPMHPGLQSLLTNAGSKLEK